MPGDQVRKYYSHASARHWFSILPSSGETNLKHDQFQWAISALKENVMVHFFLSVSFRWCYKYAHDAHKIVMEAYIVTRKMPTQLLNRRTGVFSPGQSYWKCQFEMKIIALQKHFWFHIKLEYCAPFGNIYGFKLQIFINHLLTWHTCSTESTLIDKVFLIPLQVSNIFCVWSDKG